MEIYEDHIKSKIPMPKEDILNGFSEDTRLLYRGLHIIDKFCFFLSMMFFFNMKYTVSIKKNRHKLKAVYLLLVYKINILSDLVLQEE